MTQKPVWVIYDLYADNYASQL